MKIGTRVTTLYEYSQTGVIVKPRRGETPPTSDWYIVQFDDSGGKMCIHRSMLAQSDAPRLGD